MENKKQYLAENEIHLRDYINVMIKRRKTILVVVLTSVFTAIIANFLMPKVYEVSSAIQLGSFNGFLIGKDDAKEIILNNNSLLSVINELNLKTGAEALKKDIKIKDINGTNLIALLIAYHGFDTAVKINDAIVKPLISRGQSIYQERLALTNERLKELDAEIKNAEADIDRTQNLISGLPSASNISQSDVSLRIILLQNNLPNYESNLSALRNQRNGLKFLIADSKDFKIVDAPVRPQYPVSPNKTRNVAISGAISLMFGVFLAFFMEYWEKAR